MASYQDDFDDDDMYDHDERSNERSKGKARADPDDEEEEEEAPRRRHYDDDEDDEEDEEEEEEEVGRKSKKRRKSRKQSGVTRFIDLEAEVSDEDEEEEDEEDDTGAFIEQFDEDDAADDLSRRHHALLDTRRQFEEEDKSPEQIAQDLSKRYGGRAALRYTGDMNDVPQRLLMPSVHDPSLWQVRVRPGKERDIIFSLMRKSIDMEYTAHPLNIMSAFQRDSLPGMIYVEARSSKQVQQAVNGLVGVFLSRGINLVPIEEMASLLTIKKQEQTVQAGSWVRIGRGKYAGDLAQVMDITENGEDVGLRFIPRIDLTPRDDDSQDLTKKRKKPATTGVAGRPPQKLFNYEEVTKVYGRKNVHHKRGNTYLFQNDTYRDGFIEKDFKVATLRLEDVNPTLDEITQFMGKDGGTDVDNVVDLSVIAEASKKAAIAVLQPGDHVEVFEGEQAGVHGTVEEINGDIVTITAMGSDIEGQKVELEARSVRKRFKPGDHVKVMQGQNADETGLVISVADNVVTFLSDMSMQEVSVFSKDLREAAEVGSSTNIIGAYELHDLVQLDAQTVGVIFKTEHDSFRVLDQNGQVRLVQPHQISMRRDSNRAIACDSQGHELRTNDNVKEVDGEGRKGRVLHTHQSFFAFLHNREIAENGGVFVTRARSLTSQAPKGNVFKGGADLSKMNPAVGMAAGGMVGSGAMGRGPRDRHIGLTVTVIKGPNKGYVGRIKDTNGNIARVELLTGNKVISIDKEKLRKMLPDGKLESLDARTPWGGPPGGGGLMGPPSGGRTPFGAGSSKTPNPYAMDNGGKTPAWNSSSRTPNPYAENSGKTPAWSASSRTPNPYADQSGRTPAWSANSRTPNPYAAGANAGSGSNSYGGATPGRNLNSTSSWGGATPGRAAWDNDSWGGGWGQSAATPAAAATPGYGMAQTPGMDAAPTPGPAQTPAAYGGYGGSAATPAPYGGGWGSSMVDSEPQDIGEDWIFDDALSDNRPRAKIEIRGTKGPQYLAGEYEGRRGRITAGTRTAPNLEQTVNVLFEHGEQRSVGTRYIKPVQPTMEGEEVLVLAGIHKGQTMVVREPDEDSCTVSTRTDPGNVKMVPKRLLVTLYDHQ